MTTENAPRPSKFSKWLPYKLSLSVFYLLSVTSSSPSRTGRYKDKNFSTWIIIKKWKIYMISKCRKDKKFDTRVSRGGKGAMSWRQIRTILLFYKFEKKFTFVKVFLLKKWKIKSNGTYSYIFRKFSHRVRENFKNLCRLRREEKNIICHHFWAWWK